MQRFAIESLKRWSKAVQRKPLILRGARQVGKTYLVRQFGKEHFENVVEYNFDRTPEKMSFFKDSKPQNILDLLSIDANIKIIPGRTLLFLDEIQAAPEIFAKLRYFYEEIPELHIIAAGSLLDFALRDFQYSVPVGRIEYMFMGPMQFEEFLWADGHELLLDYFRKFELGQDLPEAIHQKALDLFREYCIIGGMPASIQHWVEHRDYEMVEREQQANLQSFINDFAKYGAKTPFQPLQKVFKAIPAMVGEKIKYSRIDSNEKSALLANCFELLQMARLTHKVSHSSTNGLPLSFESKSTDFKALFLDVGLMNSALGVKATEFFKAHVAEIVHRGALCEQFVGQHLLYIQEDYVEPQLYYWNREKKNSSAEVDYLIALDGEIIPVEVKAGKTGRLKSLQLFMGEKKKHKALRFNADLPSLVKIDGISGLDAPYVLLNLPFYMIGQAKRLLGAIEG